MRKIRYYLTQFVSIVYTALFSDSSKATRCSALISTLDENLHYTSKSTIEPTTSDVLLSEGHVTKENAAYSKSRYAKLGDYDWR